jgi:CRP-like cAMP-binding protein
MPQRPTGVCAPPHHRRKRCPQALCAGAQTGPHAPAHTLPLTQNRLIERLPRRDRTRLLAVCEPVQLLLSEELCRRGEPVRHVYFPTHGFISLVAQVDQHPSLGVAMVGREGMVGASLVLGVLQVPLRALVQGAGAAWRVESTAFRRELQGSPALQGSLGRYLYVLMAQVAVSAACLRFHLILPRLARWLLMSQDRAHADSFHVTHEFLAHTLGVRRVGVTTAAGALQRSGLIVYHRGEVTVLDRPGLEAAACTCYATGADVYAHTVR